MSGLVSLKGPGNFQAGTTRPTDFPSQNSPVPACGNSRSKRPGRLTSGIKRPDWPDLKNMRPQRPRLRKYEIKTADLKSIAREGHCTI